MLASSAACVDVRIWDTNGNLKMQDRVGSSNIAKEQQAAALKGLALIVENIASFRTLGQPFIPNDRYLEGRKLDFNCPIAFSPNGKLIGLVRHSEELSSTTHTEIYDVESGRRLSRVNGTMSSVAFSPDGSKVITSEILHLLRFNPNTGGEQVEFR